jgi:hypothetical protein
MKKIIALILLTFVSSRALIAVDHEMVFVGTGQTHDDAERHAKDKANPHGGVGSVVSIETTQIGPNKWMCVLTAKVSN